MGQVDKGKWYEISEASRTYTWHDGTSLKITDVVGFLVSKRGNHYLKTSTGKQFIVVPGWKYLSFLGDGFITPEKEGSK